jgi:hypothetical protein
MLMKTGLIYQRTPTPQDEPTRHVTGQYLAKNRLDDRERDRLAADLLDGRAILGPLTAKQIIALCRANQAGLPRCVIPADGNVCASSGCSGHGRRSTPITVPNSAASLESRTSGTCLLLQSADPDSAP